MNDDGLLAIISLRSGVLDRSCLYGTNTGWAGDGGTFLDGERVELQLGLLGDVDGVCAYAVRGGDAGRHDIFVKAWFPKGSKDVREGVWVISKTTSGANKKQAA